MAGEVGIADKPQMRLEASLGKGFTQPSNAAGNTTGPGIHVRAFKAEDVKLHDGVTSTLQYHWGLHKPPGRSAQGSSPVRSPCCLRDRGAQPLHGGSHPFALIKNRRSGDQHVGPAATTSGAVAASMPPSTSRSHPSLLCAIIW